MFKKNIKLLLIVFTFVFISVYLAIDNDSETYAVIYDEIGETYAENEHIADFLAMFEGADNGYSCGGGTGYKVKNNTPLTTAFGLTKYPIGTEYPRDNTSDSPCKVTPNSSYANYFRVGSTYVGGACIPKDVIKKALVCHINYAKKHINTKFRQLCGSKAPTLTQQEMAALVDYYNTGIGYANKAIEAYCSKINQGKDKANDALFKSIFKKENGNSNGNCSYIKRRECEAILYFQGNYTCYGQSAYDGTFIYSYQKYHDSGYNCSGPSVSIIGNSTIEKGELNPYNLSGNNSNYTPSNIKWKVSSGLSGTGSNTSSTYKLKGTSTGQKTVTVTYKIGNVPQTKTKSITVIEPDYCSSIQASITGSNEILVDQQKTYRLIYNSDITPTNIKWTKTGNLNQIGSNSGKNYKVKGISTGYGTVSVEYKLNGQKCNKITKNVTIKNINIYPQGSNNIVLPKEEQKQSISKLYIYIPIAILICIGIFAYMFIKKSKNK